MDDMVTSYHRAFLAYLVLDSGCAQAFASDVSVSAAGRPLGKRVCGLDCGSTVLDIGLSQSNPAITEIAICTGYDLSRCGGCNPMGVNKCNEQ